MSNAQLLRLWLALLLPGSLLAVAAHFIPYWVADVAATSEVQEQRPGEALMSLLMRAVSVAGDYPWSGLLLATACLALLTTRRWRESLLVLLTLTGDGMALLVKALVGRQRPSADLVNVYVEVQGYSYPSGHVVHYVVFFGALAYLAYQALDTASTARRGLRLALVVCWLLVLTIGLSRMYLGAHWLSDVLGGYLLGGAWLVTLIAVIVE